MKGSIFLDTTLFSLLKVNQSFKGTSHLHLQETNMKQVAKQALDFQQTI
jgi:hypothetical protein